MVGVGVIYLHAEEEERVLGVRLGEEVGRVLQPLAVDAPYPTIQARRRAGGLEPHPSNYGAQRAHVGERVGARKGHPHRYGRPSVWAVPPLAREAR